VLCPEGDFYENVFSGNGVVLFTGFNGGGAVSTDTQTNSNLTRYYDAELFQWDYGMFLGLTLHFQNQSAMPIHGIKTPMKNALKQYEDSRQKYNAYQRKTVFGNILMWGGLVAVIAGYMPIFRAIEHGYEPVDKNIVELSASMVLGGFVSEIISLFFLQSGQESIFDAVYLYNRHQIDAFQLTGPVAGFKRAAWWKGRRQSASYRLVFLSGILETQEV
jgi:hypothetical protein